MLRSRYRRSGSKEQGKKGEEKEGGEKWCALHRELIVVYRSERASGRKRYFLGAYDEAGVDAIITAASGSRPRWSSSFRRLSRQSSELLGHGLA